MSETATMPGAEKRESLREHEEQLQAAAEQVTALRQQLESDDTPLSDVPRLDAELQAAERVYSAIDMRLGRVRREAEAERIAEIKARANDAWGASAEKKTRALNDLEKNVAEVARILAELAGIDAEQRAVLSAAKDADPNGVSNKLNNHAAAQRNRVAWIASEIGLTQHFPGASMEIPRVGDAWASEELSVMGRIFNG